MLKKTLVLFASVLFLFSCSKNNESELLEKYPLLYEAEKLSMEAFELLGNERNEYFRRSAAKLIEAEKVYNLNNGYIYYNIGNAWLSAGNIGKAIISYKKAEQRLPSNDNIRKNLAYARSIVKDDINYGDSSRLIKTLFFVHYDISFKYKTMIFIFFLFLTFGSASYILFRRNKVIKNLLILFTILSILMSISLIIELSKGKEGVITQKEIIARNGDSNGYESSFTSPLHEGVEFRLIESRHEWFQIQLADGRECWIPEYAAELIE